MASKQKIEKTLSLLNQMFRIDGPEIQGEWTRLLEGMTNEQVDIAVAHMRENHRGSFVPPMAVFKDWGRAPKRMQKSERPWWHTHEIHVVTDSENRHHALCAPGEGAKGTPHQGATVKRPILVPKSPGGPRERLTHEEYQQRLRGLLSVLNGERPEVDWSQFKNLQPDDVEKRNRLREIMGWGPLAQPETDTPEQESADA